MTLAEAEPVAAGVSPANLQMQPARLPHRRPNSLDPERAHLLSKTLFEKKK
jgi:hypothetical protein